MDKLKKYLKQKRLLVFILAPIAYLLTLFAQNNPHITENVISTGFYKVYSSIVSTVFGIFPFSVGEILIVLGPVAIIVFLVITIVKTIKNKNAKSIVSFLTNACILVSCVYFVFTISCGVNYYRLTFDNYCDFEDRQYTPKELQFMCESFIDTANELRENFSEEDLAVVETSYFEKLELSKLTYDDMKKLENEYPVLSGWYSKPKPVLLSHYMSYTNITGVFFPWTIEANVNVDVPYYQIPFTMLHEQAHQRGFMREDEANFIAYLAGKNSNSDIVKYSTYMAAAIYSMNSLYGADYDLFEETYFSYSEKVNTDKNSSSLYWKQFEGPVADKWEDVNDNYLKGQGQDEGVISYGNVTELLLKDFYS